MRRPVVILAAAVLSGILYRLPGVPVVYRIAAAVFDLAAGSCVFIRCRGRKRLPLLFLFLMFAGCFVFGLLRTDQLVRKYEQPEIRDFLKKYEATNPGEFDYAVYLKSLGITNETERKALKTRNRETEGTLRQVLGDSRESAAGILDTWFCAEDAGIVKAVLLGEKNGMEQEVKELYQASGIGHLLAVSGLHVSMVGAAVLYMAGKMGFGKYSGVFISVLAVLLYAVFTGSTASSLRAAIMFGFGGAAMIGGRKKDMASFLSIALVLLLLKNPFLLLQSGFQLSFGAVSGVLLSRSVFAERNRDESDESKQNQEKAGLKDTAFSITGFLLRAKESLQVSLCVSIAVIPIVAFYFFRVPLYSILLNLIVIPLMTVLFLSGVFVLVTGGIYGYLSFLPGRPFITAVLPVQGAGIAHYILKFYAILSELTLKLPGARILLGRPSHGAILAYYLLLFIFILSVKLIKSRKPVFPALIFIYLLSFPMLMHREEEETYVTVLDVGQGDCFHIHSGSTDILIDCGSSGSEWAGSGIAENYLLSKRISSVDLMIASHADSDHTNGLVYLLSDESSVDAEMLVLPAMAAKDAKYEKLKSANRKIPVRYAGAGTAFKDQSIELCCIYSETDPAAMNDANRESSVWLLKSGNFSMLFTGDITEKEENAIADLYDGYQQKQQLTVLKCAHHGSDTANCERFLNVLNPELAVLSYGEGNRYGHPSEKVIERLRSNKIPYVSTAERGSIRFVIRENRIRMSTWKTE